MEETYELITCKHCFKEFAFILKHLDKENVCKSTYNETELNSLRMYSKSIKEAKRKKYKSDKYQLDHYDKNFRAELYKNHKTLIAAKYDKFKRGDKYLGDKYLIAKQNQRNKGKNADYYQRNKSKIAEKNKKNKSISAKKCKGTKKDSSPEYTKLLNSSIKNVLDIIIDRIHDELLVDTKEKVNDNYEDICDEALNKNFTSQHFWRLLIKDKVHDCYLAKQPCGDNEKPCIYSLSDSELDMMIETAMEESYPKFIDEELERATNYMYNEELEWSHRGSVISDTMQFAQNKLILGKFDSNFQKLYQLGHAKASQISENKDITEVQFQSLLEENILLFSEEGPFFDQIFSLINSEYKKQFEMKMSNYRLELEKIATRNNLSSKRLARNLLNKQIDMLRQTDNLAKEIKNKIKQIKIAIDVSYIGIETEITEAFENSSEFFMHTKDWFKEIEKLLKNVWLDEELYMLESFINVPCKCEVCVEKSHDKIWCYKIVRQREQGRQKYTCPGCQKLIHKYNFNKHHDICTLKGTK
jgi:hypothetical protein